MSEELMRRAETTPTISVIMPAYNAAHYMEQSLPPLVDMLERGTVSEVIVVDDCSMEAATAELACRCGARTVRTPRNGGPSAARNLAAKEAVGEILWFVDADVIAHRDAPERIRRALADRTVSAVFGSYDDSPPAPAFAAQYKNLTHRYYHQSARREASTFWAGCGAVRRSIFLELRGFDVERYPVPSIEDIELAYRIRALGGRILLDHQLHATHLKAWTVLEVIRVDFFRRAIPWARLMIGRTGLTDDLNVSAGERLRAGLAGLFFLSLSLPFVVASLWWAPALATAAVLAANKPFLSFMRARRGVFFAIKSLLFHQVYYLYSATAFVFCLFEHHLKSARSSGWMAGVRRRRQQDHC
jgi:glycosyltransferase involved in cell wall biosynthesis